MVPRNTTFEVEQIEQLFLIDALPAHHDPPPLPRASGRRNHDSSATTRDFFNSIDLEQTCATALNRIAHSAHSSHDFTQYSHVRTAVRRNPYAATVSVRIRFCNGSR